MSDSAVKQLGRGIDSAMVSTADQNLDRQLRERYEVDADVHDRRVRSGEWAAGTREGVAELGAGDTLVVTRLDRAGLQADGVELPVMRSIASSDTASGAAWRPKWTLDTVCWRL